MHHVPVKLTLLVQNLLYPFSPLFMINWPNKNDWPEIKSCFIKQQEYVFLLVFCKYTQNGICIPIPAIHRMATIAYWRTNRILNEMQLIHYKIHYKVAATRPHCVPITYFLVTAMLLSMVADNSVSNVVTNHKIKLIKHLNMVCGKWWVCNMWFAVDGYEYPLLVWNISFQC